MTTDGGLFGGEEHATAVSRPYWDAVHDGRLELQKCARCGRHQHYPRRLCRYCSSEAVSFVATSGVGRVFASTVVHRSNTSHMRAMVPYRLALVRTDEGPLVFALLDVAADQPGSLTDIVVEVDPDRTRELRLLTVRVGGTSTRPPLDKSREDVP
jgi:hypothetical protein